MSNKHMIKSAHIYFLTVLVACGLWAVAGKAGIRFNDQNSNQNSNTANQEPRSQNRNENKRTKSNSNTSAMGEQTGMANMTSQDRNFLQDAAMGGLMEVELGRVAAQKGTSDAVKQFGQRMVDDHSKANSDLMSVASSKGITLPTTLDEKHQKELTKLSAMSGAEFDRAYSKMMLSDHVKDVSEFEKQSTKGTDADLKAFASKTLPTLQEHLQLAKALPDNAGAGNSNSGGAKNSNRNSNSNRP
jgi:putative membrane protein